MSDAFTAGDPPPLPFADAHPAWCAGHGTAGDWFTIGASVVGLSHIRRFRARDDAFLMMAGGGYLVAAVADGVGGEMYSRIGAAHCVNFICRDLLCRLARPHVRRAGVDDFDPATLPRQLAALGVSRETPLIRASTPAWASSATYRWSWQPYHREFPTDLFEEDDPPPDPLPADEAVRSSFEATHNSFVELAHSLRLRPRQLTCTLLLTVVSLADGRAVAVQLGDGAIVTFDALTPVCKSSVREDNGNPYTMADSDWAKGFNIVSASGSGFLLATDGAEEFLKECCDLLRSPLEDSPKALQLLELLQTARREGCEDDRTVVWVGSQ